MPNLPAARPIAAQRGCEGKTVVIRTGADSFVKNVYSQRLFDNGLT
jgi:hypothetical protein